MDLLCFFLWSFCVTILLFVVCVCFGHTVLSVSCSHLLGNSYVFALPFYASVYMCLVVTCWERAGLLALVCGVLL